MSILVVDKLMRSSKDKILIGQAKDEYLYFDKKNLNGPKEYQATTDIDIMPYVDTHANQRSMTFIAALSGSGKSMIASELCKRLRRIRKNSKKKIVVFTISEDQDKAFDDIENMVWFPLVSNRSEFLHITADTLKNNIVLFDDYSSIIDTAYKKYVIKFIQDIAERGRKLNIDIVICGHQLQGNHDSKAIIFEADNYMVNPITTLNASKKFLESYGDFSKDDMKELNKLIANPHNAYQFLTFRKSYPRYLHFQNKLILI